jgi:hypothetical protein
MDDLNKPQKRKKSQNTKKKSQKEIVKSRIGKLDKLDKLCVSKLKFKEPTMPSQSILFSYVINSDVNPLLNDPYWINDFIQHNAFAWVEFILDSGFLNNQDIFDTLLKSFQDKLQTKYGNRSNNWNWLSILLVSDLHWVCLLQFPQIVSGFIANKILPFQAYLLHNITFSRIWVSLEKTCFQRFREDKLKEHKELQCKEEFAMQSAKFHLQYKLPISMGFYISKIKSGNMIVVKVPVEENKEIIYKLDKIEQTNWFSFTHPAWTSHDIIPVMTIDARVQPIVRILMKKTHGIFHGFIKDIILFANLCDLKTDPNFSRFDMLKTNHTVMNWASKVGPYLLQCNTNQTVFDLETCYYLKDRYDYSKPF